MGSLKGDWSTARVLADPELYEKIWLFSQVPQPSVEHYLTACSLRALDTDETLLAPDTPKFIIESDATIVAPLVFAHLLGW